MKNLVTNFNTSTDNKLKLLINSLAIFLLLYVALITSWISDDAQITFRQILNFISGLGITFQFGERVQAFTHPLWFLLSSAVIAITRELFVTTSILNIVLSMSSIILLTKLDLDLNKKKVTLISPIYYLIFSCAFCDYMTSGLENSLTYFLVVLLFYHLFHEKFYVHLRSIFIILALIVLNRFDYVILFFPLSLILIFSYVKKHELIRVLLPGLLLLLIWFIFATIYFGSPLPNTFYAKLNADYARSEIFFRGWQYFLSLKFDLISLLILIFGFLSIFLFKNKILIGLFLGKILYLIYIFNIGGDFMQGRFFSTLVLISICEIIYIFSKCRLSEFSINSISTTIFFIFLLIGILIGSPITSNTEYTPRNAIGGIADERGAYYRQTGLFSKSRDDWPTFKYLPKKIPENYIVLCGVLGQNSLSNPNLLHIDACALAEPFLARIPAVRHKNWRIGHHFRKIPTEYGRYKIGKVSEIPDNSLHGLLNDVTLISRGVIFSKERFGAIWRLFLNTYSGLNYEKYVDPNYWIPTTNTTEQIIVDDWNREFHSVNFNNNIKIIAKVPNSTSKIWIDLNYGYTYEFFINDRLVKTFNKNRNYCKNGVILNFREKINVNQIEIRTIDTIDLHTAGFNRLENFQINSPKQLEFIIEPECTVGL